MGVTTKSTLWDAVFGLMPHQLPHTDGLVSRGGQCHVWELRSSRNLGHPVIVALEGAMKGHLFSCGGCRCRPSQETATMINLIIMHPRTHLQDAGSCVMN